MSGPPRRAPDAGLTLVEVLVALALFALVSVAGASLLSTVLRVNQGTEGQLDRLAEIDRALLVLRRDLAQLAPGGTALDPGGLGFLRSDGAAEARQELRVADGSMLRVLRAPDGARVEQRLLEGVDSAGWRLLDAGRTWRAVWPDPDPGPDPRPDPGPGRDANPDATAPPPPPPLAAELTLRLTHLGATEDLVRVFALPEAARR